MEMKLNEADMKQAAINYVYQKLATDERNTYTYKATCYWRGKYVMVELTKKFIQT